MPRRYDVSLLDKIRQGQYETDYEGVPVLVKPIPEGGDDGELDPRLYKSMRFMPLLMHFMPKPKKNATVEEQVAMPRKMFSQYKGDYVVTEWVDTRCITVNSADGYAVPVRVYKRSNAGKNLPMLVYYHGGGFFGGGLDIVEQMCKVLVRDRDCVVLSVDYRLCPEAHYPQPLDDCRAVTRWAFEHAEELGGGGGPVPDHHGRPLSDGHYGRLCRGADLPDCCVRLFPQTEKMSIAGASERSSGIFIRKCGRGSAAMWGEAAPGRPERRRPPLPHCRQGPLRPPSPASAPGPAGSPRPPPCPPA